jgi:O-antigen/teichoic acid export membrane protein
VSLHQAAFQGGRFVIAAVLAGALGGTAVVGMSGFVVCALIVTASQFVRVSHWATPLWRPQPTGVTIDKWSRRLTTYFMPMTTWGVFTALQSSSDRWALGLYAGTEAVGLYAVLSQLSLPFSLIAGTVSGYVGPILCEISGDGLSRDRIAAADRLVNRLVLGSLGLTVVGALTAALIHERLFALVVGPQYRAVSHWLPLVVFTAGLFATGQFASMRGMIRESTKSLAVPKIATAVIGVVCMFVGARLDGLPGVLIGGLVFSVVYLAWMLRVR